jgi:hypothetical protein
MGRTRVGRVAFLLILLLFLLACGSSVPNTAVQTTALAIATLAPTPTPTLEPVLEPTVTPTPEVVRVAPIQNANCRSGPSTDYPVLLSIPAGTEVIVLGQNADSSWFYIQNPQTSGDYGWVKASLVRFVFGSELLLPVFTPIAPPPVVYPTAPTAPPAVPTVACEGSGSLFIVNDTGGIVTLYLTGPAKYTFHIAAGSQTLTVCPGTYSYTGYGCGGASKNGTVATDTEEVIFYGVSN